MSEFASRLAEASRRNRSAVCVGLDPDLSLMPIADVRAFNRAIIDATRDLVCAYKPNLAFYEALGMEGLEALRDTLAYARDQAPDAVLLGDAKRGDIQSTNVKHAEALFDFWGFDAITVNAFAGGESLAPFFERADRGVFVWCRASNPGSQEFQDAPLAVDEWWIPGAPDEELIQLAIDNWRMPLYEWIAERSMDWNGNGNLGLVVGATYPEQLSVVRGRCPAVPILIPAVGAQGGELEAAVKNGLDASGVAPNILINSSRGILYAEGSAEGFAAAARAAAANLREGINAALERAGWAWG